MTTSHRSTFPYYTVILVAIVFVLVLWRWDWKRRHTPKDIPAKAQTQPAADGPPSAPSGLN